MSIELVNHYHIRILTVLDLFPFGKSDLYRGERQEPSRLGKVSSGGTVVIISVPHSFNFIRNHALLVISMFPSPV